MSYRLDGSSLCARLVAYIYLRVTLASVAGFRTRLFLFLCTTLYNGDTRCALVMTCILCIWRYKVKIQSCFSGDKDRDTYHFGHIELLFTVGNSKVGTFFGVAHRRIEVHHANDNIRSRFAFASTRDHAITNDKKALANKENEILHMLLLSFFFTLCFLE